MGKKIERGEHTDGENKRSLRRRMTKRLRGYKSLMVSLKGKTEVATRQHVHFEITTTLTFYSSS